MTHVALDLQADFTAHTLGGRATLTFVRRPGVRELVLDTRGLEIGQVLDERQQPLTFRLEPPVEHLGQALVIALPATGDRVVVEYRTSPDAAALAVADAGADRRAHPSLPLFAGAGDPDAHVDPDAGQPGDPADLRGVHHRAASACASSCRRR